MSEVYLVIDQAEVEAACSGLQRRDRWAWLDAGSARPGLQVLSFLDRDAPDENRLVSLRVFADDFFYRGQQCSLQEVVAKGPLLDSLEAERDCLPCHLTLYSAERFGGLEPNAPETSSLENCSKSPHFRFRDHFVDSVRCKGLA